MKSKIEKLEMVRGLAAMYVVAGHYCLNHPSPLGAAFALLLRFGQEAVIAFFLLSGFVIYYSTYRHHDQSFRGYFRRRVLRIYPIFTISLLISYFTRDSAVQPTPGWQAWVGNLFMLQDFAYGKPGVWIDTFCGNMPLWSLSYEWWFYMMFFPIYKGVSEPMQLFVVAAISAVGLFSYAWHPNQVSLFLLYFILWWSGVELARTFGRGIAPTFNTQRFPLLLLGAFCILVPAVMLFFMPHPSRLTFGIHPILEIRHFTAGFIMLGAGLIWSGYRWKGFSRLFSVFLLVAPISYAIYVFHYPVGLYMLRAAWIPGDFLRICAALVTTLVLAYMAEIPLQRAISGLFNPKRRPPERLVVTDEKATNDG